MDPVRVYTGRADPVPGAPAVSGPAPAGKVPMPRLRPPLPGARAYAPEALPSPTTLVIKPPLDLTH
jgi:hypothetical protein